MKEISKVKTFLEENIESLISEFNILKKLHYPFISNLYFSYQDNEYIFLILDYLPGGTLRNQIPETPPLIPIFSENQIKFLISNIILSLEYIHNQGIIHRDLKPENLLFDNEGYLHLTDFGISKIYNSENSEIFDISGTPGYISPEIIKDYTQVVLTNRLEILMGIEGSLGQYDLIKERYSQIISLADKYYDLVIVDLDNKIGEQAEIDILNESDIIVSMISQRANQIENVAKMLKENKILKSDKTIIAIGKYMEQTKYNAKNISRNILKTRDMVNTIPYNKLFFECSQEGKIVDLFIHYMKVKEKDENYFFIQELKRLYETIQIKLSMR